MSTQNDEAVEVAKVKSRAKVITGKPRKILSTSGMRSKVAFPAAGGFTGGSGGNFYSPELSTDFLELPQSLDEQRNYYRFFYKTDPFVGQAVDLHTELPLSKVRLGMPKAKNRELAEKSMAFCEKWATKHKLLHRLIEIVHEYNLVGEVFAFMEDSSPDMPKDITHETIREITADGELVEKEVKRKDADERAAKWLKKNYRGWTAIRVLPPEQIHMESFPFTDEKIIELIPDSKTKNLIGQANAGDTQAERIVRSMPKDVVDAILNGQNIPLNTDPEAGSFVYYLCRKKSQYEPRGHSVLERCLLPGTLVTVLREGYILDIPVEDVNVSTDMLLTHKGRFQPAQKGTRPVDEMCVELTVEGAEETIRLTAEHLVLRLNADGTEEWVEAGNLKVGDTLREAHVVPESVHPLEIDLLSWWQGRQIKVDRRVRENLTGQDIPDRLVQVADASVSPEGSLCVTFEHAQDDAGRTDAVRKLTLLVNWLKALTGPTEATYAQIQEATGLSYKDVQNYAHLLRAQSGLHTESRVLGRGKGRATTWYPLPAETPVIGEISVRTETSAVTTLNLTMDLMWLLGTWLGDGDLWVSKEKFLNCAGMGWTFGTDPVATAVHDRVLKVAEGLFGCENVNSGHPFGDNRKDRNTTRIQVQDALMGRWLWEEFGHLAQGKKIPAWVFQLPETHILALLQGVLDTDGCLTLGKLSRIEITLDNTALIRQLHLLCSRVGIQTQMKWSRKKARSWTRQWWAKDGWVEKTYHYEPKNFAKLVSSRADGTEKWAKGDGSVKGSLATWPERFSQWPSKFQKGWLTRKVLSTYSFPYKGDVFSFGVGGDESHVAHNIIVHNCMRTLVYRDKLRQAQTSIASRHMTPMRIVSAEDMDANDTEQLREQVDLALADPDYSIVTNFTVTWEEMGSSGRLLDLTSEHDLTDRQLYAGLGVTESMLSGESSYSGDRINLEVINTRYMLLREIIQDFVEQHIFRPMCARMGFIEKDEDGEDLVIFPSMTFTRLGLRDSADTFDHLFSLYQKGSLDIDIILELLNIDPVTTRKKIDRDMWTPNDPTFNEATRAVYGAVAEKLVEGSDVLGKIATGMGLKYTPPKPEGSEERF